MYQTEKQLVRDFYAALESVSAESVSSVCQQYFAESCIWRGYYPFNEISSPAVVGETFWRPLREALQHMQRREDVFMAGVNRQADGDSGVWVVSMGHLMGLFDRPWLGIPPTGKLAMLRYCEFNKVEEDRITETAMFFDIPHLMIQAGLNPFPPMTGAQLVQPGPQTHTGLMFEPQDPAEGDRTYAAIEFMVNDIKTWQTELPLEEELRRSWHEDMLWWGPTGIGATYTIERYAKQHSGPFRAGFKERIFNGHICRIAEGEYGGFFGWPNLKLRPSGGFMGMPATDKFGDFRVIDIYRRRGDKLVENWIFIDLLYFWHQQGVDILERTVGIKP